MWRGLSISVEYSWLSHSWSLKSNEVRVCVSVCVCVFGLPSVCSSKGSYREKRRGVGKGEQGEGRLGLHLLSEVGVLLRRWKQAAGAIGLPRLHSPFVAV